MVSSISVKIQSTLFGSAPPLAEETENVAPGSTTGGSTTNPLSVTSPSRHNTVTSSKKTIGELSSQKVSEPCLFAEGLQELPLYPKVKELISDPSAHCGLGGESSSHGVPSSRVTQVMATLTMQSPGDPGVGGVPVGVGGVPVGVGGVPVGVGGVPVGDGAVGDGGNGILPPSDCSKRFQNLASSCAKFSCRNVASPAETKARVPNAIPACKKNFIVVYTYRNVQRKIFLSRIVHCLVEILNFFETFDRPTYFLRL